MRPMKAIRARNYDERGDCRGCGHTLGWGNLPPRTSVVYQNIERHCRRNSGVMPTQADLATAMGVSRPTMTDHFKILVKLGYLSNPGKGRYDLLRYSAAEAIRKVEVEIASLQVQLDVQEQRSTKSAGSTAQLREYEATIRKQVGMIKSLKERLLVHEPEAREARREDTHTKIQALARQAPQAGSVAPKGPGALEGQDELP